MPDKSGYQMSDKDSHEKLSGRYFNYLAGRYPVMCASDEFHFLPRAENARYYYDKLENLDAQSIAETVDTLKDFQKEISHLGREDDEFEKQVDLELLKANIAGVLIELEHKRSWQYNPLLYLKIAFIGLDHALNKPAGDIKDRNERTLTRLSAIPRLLRQAIKNIESVPDEYLQASIYMLEDCKHYVKEIGNELIGTCSGESSKIITRSVEGVVSNLDSFYRFLKQLAPVTNRRKADDTLEATIDRHFLSVRSLDDIFQIAADEWHQNLRNLEALASKLDTGKSWQELYHDYYPSEIDSTDTMSLYAQEINKLGLFFKAQGFSKEAIDSPVNVSATPMYLSSVRAAASFAAAFTADIREKSFFYITSRFPRQNSHHADTMLKKRFHREYKPLAAHETIPGHHYLDSIRRRLENPVRRQIESPLFYEGWASFAESLLIDYGYVSSPLDLLVHLKRNLWRSARCQIDAGLFTGRITGADAMDLLKICSFSPQEAQRQIDRFQLNPGYQVCYSLGSYEFRQLKTTFESKMGSKRFHETVLDGGELPFHLLEKRLSRCLKCPIT
jgi:uncharacterized protein (DUF885 family)